MAAMAVSSAAAYGTTVNADNDALNIVGASPIPNLTPDPAWAGQMLTEHNALRQRYNVPPLVWDDAVANGAQAWAERIALRGATPPEHRESQTIGENIVWGTAGQFTPQFLIDRWGREAGKYDMATNTCTPEYGCLHFTQVVWSTTTKLGCGKATTSDGKTDFVVCNYSPTGNIRGQKPLPSPTPSAKSECDVCSAVQKLAAQVEQLKPTDSKTAPKNNAVPAKTTLLFPFVTQQNGFDTGISIANTSADTLGTKPTAGHCELNYWGGTIGGKGEGGAAPPKQSTTVALQGGQVMAFTLDSGGTNGIMPTRGFQGYIIATCNFPYARGFAFISDVGSQKLAHGYIAEIVTDPRVP